MALGVKDRYLTAVRIVTRYIAVLMRGSAYQTSPDPAVTRGCRELERGPDASRWLVLVRVTWNFMDVAWLM